MNHSPETPAGARASHVPPRRWAVVFLAVLLTAAAWGLEIPPIGGIDAPSAEPKRVSLFLGGSFVTDSNVRRAPDGEGDTVTELLAGISLRAGNERSKFDLSCQYRQDSYGELEELDFAETRALLGVHLGADKIGLALRAEYASLVDPVDIEVTDLLERRRLAYAPELNLTMGRLGLGLGYFASSVEYADDAFAYLDHADTACRAEVRLGRRGRQLFFHYDFLGSVDYGEDVRSDFEYSRFYAGWRSESARKSGIELGAGTNAVEGFSRDPSFSKEELFAVFRSTLFMREGRSALELTYTSGAEAAAWADYKTVKRGMIRYSHRAGPRWGFSIGVSHESADYTYLSEASPPEALSRLSGEAGIRIAIGSPGRTHGTLMITASYETRSGDSADDDYDRLRTLVGLALVH